MAEETKQTDPVEETKLESPEIGKLDPSPEPQITEPSQPEGEPSPDEPVDYQKQYEEAVKAMNTAQQTAAQTQKQLEIMAAQNQQYEQAIQSLAGSRSDTNADPVAAAEARLIEAEQSYDPQMKIEALRAYNEATAAKNRQDTVVQAIQAMQAQQQLQQAASLLGMDEQTALAELNNIAQTANPVELAHLRMLRKGELPDYLAKQKEAAEANAARAEAINALTSPDLGGGRATPGAISHQQAPKTVSYLTYAGSNKATKAAFRERGYTVMGLDGEPIPWEEL